MRNDLSSISAKYTVEDWWEASNMTKSSPNRVFTVVINKKMIRLRFVINF